MSKQNHISIKKYYFDSDNGMGMIFGMPNNFFTLSFGIRVEKWSLDFYQN